jgi:tripartite-type tricarboxylate transporter receptor subunit TctC
MRANSISPLMLLAATLILALAPFQSAAQDFPTRPVRFVVPYAAGGSGDLLARLLGNKLTAIWGQQVVIDNRAGGGGLIGTEFAARSDPDGYTLYLATDGPLTVAASLYKYPTIGSAIWRRYRCWRWAIRFWSSSPRCLRALSRS